ncbi:Transketolase, C-terminal domain-containing protein [Pelagophyceae sp. CCMP2097]|nr:Transketolase, C-terminal domain-containing protein [Pelagophyceae sp. CCMP2097]
MPRGPRQAKGLLLAAIRDRNPTIFLEPKALYRTAVDDVPDGDFELPLGANLRVLASACDAAFRERGIECELVDLQTIVPWDAEAVCASVNKTGKLLVSHEAPRSMGFAAEVVAHVAEACFLSLEAPREAASFVKTHRTQSESRFV